MEALSGCGGFNLLPGKLSKLLKKMFGKCNSLTAETLVHTEEGLKPISEVKFSDKVLSYDERTETTSYQPVMAVIQGEQRYQLISITLDSGESIEATAEHPFYIKGKGWNPANSLKVGQALQLHNGTTVVVKEVDTSVRLEKVYNFTVANTHNYFVGVDGVLVHNAFGDEFADDRCSGTRGGKRTGKNFTGKGKKDVIEENRARNDGDVLCEYCGVKTVPAQKSQKGVTPDTRETQVDHIIPKAKGGDGSSTNGQVLCRKCNRAKWDN